ncbi:energy-coupling factor ABC transporter permease [Marinobacter mobilis]|uniref:Uncharacterized membrane protein n=1 Tax=Marinobacter mobilis TaxID=488533 RepID=A0A1H2Y489_9GAMM|nr:energy-coupling factor ABC transporter permease [Marinobacter mobilis]SDX00002.1 Uncharacterized membrane protein [Marinobacter mobilis]
MGMTLNILSPAQWLGTGALFLVVLVLALRQANWQQLKADQAIQHTLFGAAVALAVLWQIRAGLSPGLTIHIFAMTAVTLLLGWPLAVMAGLLALLMVVVTGREPWQLFAANGLITVMVPALVSHAIMGWERRRGFRNFFAYIFFCGFFGAAISVAVAGCSMVLMLWISGAYTWEDLVHEYLRYLPLIMLPEAFVNGTVVTGFMVFHPERLLTLDPHRYR